MSEIISRPNYQQRIRPFIGKDVIKVIVGQRRVGKSYFLRQVMNEISADDPSTNIININKELYEFDQLRDYHDLLAFVQEHKKEGTRNALFVDEIQDIDGFERAIQSLHAEQEFDIYITGSNAQLLSGDLATFLSGRYVEIPIYSLSYGEFLTFHKIENTRESFNKYLKYGGLPYLIHLELDDQIVYDYLSYLKAAFFVHSLKRQQIVGKKIFKVGGKYYFQDVGLKNAIVPFRQDMIGQVLENLVCNHLIFCDYNVFVGQLGSREIDFVADRQGEKLYIQVAYLIADDSVVQREFGNLLRIKDNYRKIVVSLDENIGGSIEGVEHLSVPDFLSRSL